jgi:hypothetical protein
MKTGVLGCHGVQVEPPEIGLELGSLTEPPLSVVTVEVAEAVERSPSAELVWQMDEPPGLGLPLVTSQTWREPDGSTWFGNTLNLALRIDYGEGVIKVAPKDGNKQVMLEALASIALPMVAQKQGALVVHASAASRDGKAVLFCAPGGSGKSSLMVGLIGAGWKAISEDQCVIELDDQGQHRIWPGPNWVRFKQGVPPVWPVAERRFEALDKVAWTLNGFMADASTVVDRIVFLDPPGGEEPQWKPVSPDAAMAYLGAQATWLHDQASFPRAVLPQIVNLAMRVPGFSLRLPHRTDWVTHGVAVLNAA